MEEEIEVKLVVKPRDRDLEGNIREAEIDIYVKSVPTDVIEFLEKIIEAAICSRWFGGDVFGINNEEGEWVINRWRLWRR